MKRSLQVLCTFLLVFMGLNAQRYPITVIPRVNPPAPVNFFNYADATTFNSPLSVRLLLNDITITDRQITLKVYFEGNGIQFQSKDFVVGAPTLTISGGEPIDLTNVELAPYFELQNIIGINPNTYGQVIPEGSYQFCFEVFDFITGNRLSDRTCATTYIFRNDPPILNLPANKINLEPQPVDNIVFQWTPRHINVSNVEYELSIVEIWDDTVDPQTAFLTSPPIFQATTRANTFIYGPSNPPLLTDKRYAWQVRAKALQGAEEIGLFRNEGKSEIFWFSRTAPCSPPDDVYAEAKGISKINVFWEENPAIYTEYTIAYREVNKQGAQWFTMTTNSSWATVWDLKPGTTYEYKVKGKCKYQYSEYSQVQEISTEATQDESSNYNCGIVPDAIAISNREPYTGLQVGDRITAGDFIITLTDIESSNGGRVTGKGYVKIPYLEFARFGVKYENILVNTDKQLAEGEIVTLYDPEFGEGEQMDQDVDLDLIEIINGDDGELTYVDVDFDIQDITINDDGAIVITGENGEEAIIPGGEDVVITDSDGTAWTVGEDGTVTQDTLADGGAVTADNTSGVQDGEVTSISASGVIVKFRESGFYAFDQYSNAMPDQLKDKYESLGFPDGEEYKVSYKAISNIKGEDFVELEIEITDQNITKDDIIFKTKQGIEIPVTWKDDLATLSIKKKFEYAKEEILAVVKPKNDNDQYKTAGKLNLMHLGSNKVSNIKLVVIPVNNSSITSGLKEKVNDIYNKAGVHFDISITNSINIPQDAWDLNADGKFDVGDSSVLSYYSDEENALNSYIKERINYQEETYYILVFDQPLSEASLSGFMPLKSQFGFVFGNQDQARVIAHELAHGVFGIEHPFTEYGIEEGSTNLLMDYGGGSELNHLDWKQIHAPGLQLYWFQGDEDGAAENPYLDSQNTCNENNISQSDQNYLNQLKQFSLVIDETEVSKIEETINKIKNICSLKSLDYNIIEKLLGKIIVAGSIDNDLEKAILKLLVSISEEKYTAFHNNILVSNDFNAFKNLLKRMDDEFAFYGDDNKTYFLEVIANIIAKLDNDDQKWNIVNVVIKESYGDIEKREQEAFLTIFSSIKENEKKLGQLSSINLLFTEMLVEECRNLSDFKIVFDIAELRNSNREAFASFTQSEKRRIKIGEYYFDHYGSLNWILPYGVTYKNPYYQDIFKLAEEMYEWARILKFDTGKYNRDEIQNSHLTTHDQTYQYLNRFKRSYNEYLEVYKNELNNFWKKYEGKSSFTEQEIEEILAHINAYENSSSLRKVNPSTILKVLTTIISNGKIEGEDIDSVYRKVHNDALMKLAFSLPQGNKRVLREIEDVGFKKIYQNLSGDRLSKFFAWVGQQSIEADEIQNVTKEEVIEMELASQNDYDSNTILQLESNIFQFDNFSSNIIDKIKIAANGNEIPYNKEVLIFVADDFTFLGQDFKKGTILKLPMIHAFAISNSNWNTVAENSAWLAADVISFAIGVGGLKILFTTGNVIRKSIVVADVAGSAIGALETALNASALSKEVRANIQLISLISSLPSLGMESKKFNDLITRTDNAIDQLGGVSEVTKSTLKNYLADFKKPEFRANNIIERIRTTRPNCK